MYNDDFIKFQEKLESKFGKNFTISISEMKQFILDLINEGTDVKVIYNSLLTLYRDDYVDYYDLKDLFDALDFYLPIQFSFYSEKAKEVIREIASKTSTKEELIKYLYYYYQNYKIEFKVLEVACLLMGYSLSEEFTNMNDEQRRSKVWMWDKNENPIVLSDVHAGLIRCSEIDKYFDTTDLLIPTMRYEYPMDFVFDYMDQNNIDDSVLSDHGLDRRLKSRLATKDNIKKIELFRLIFILDMSVPIAKQLLTLAGYTFSPLIKQDMFFLDYLNGKYKKVKTLIELDELAISNGVFIPKGNNFAYTFWK